MVGVAGSGKRRSIFTEEAEGSTGTSTATLVEVVEMAFLARGKNVWLNELRQLLLFVH